MPSSLLHAYSTAVLCSLPLNPICRGSHRHGQTGQDTCTITADGRHGITRDKL